MGHKMTNISEKNAKQWGFLRETTELAIKAGIDKDTGVPRTGLDVYLDAIFPNVKDWVHDECLGYVNGRFCRKRPDYRSETLKMIVEFDGIQHYQNPRRISLDMANIVFYESLGYKVIRIPYFIQLSRDAVKILFDIDVGFELFDDSIPSLGPKGDDTPAFLCNAGIIRMAKDFKRFPKQYRANIEFLKSCDEADQYLIEWKLLEEAYLRLP